MGGGSTYVPFVLNSAGYYQPTPLAGIPWLAVGFGTRSAEPPAGPLATVKQIHSADILRAETQGLTGTGDALISNTAGLILGIKTADCIPLLMVDLKQRAVAAVHAGWRGTAQRIGPLAITSMAGAFGTTAEDLHVAIGPGIGECCYEVGPEVASAFPGWGNERTHLDLSKINREQLEGAGVLPEHIYEAGLCTFCLKDFFSFRREREAAGRMLSIIGVRR